jgi:transcriptional regulator with XRE-family HTH domain
MQDENDGKTSETGLFHEEPEQLSEPSASGRKTSYLDKNPSVLSRSALEAVPLQSESASSKSKSVLRMRYEAEVSVIRRKLGELEQIRNQLGLSQRKMCQLLMVDPSAWTRWTRGGEDAPPHVYRMLQWYLALEDKYPALDANFWLSAVAKVREPEETAELKKEIAVLKEETLLNVQRGIQMSAQTNSEVMQNFEVRMKKAEKLAARRLWWILAVALLGSLFAGISSTLFLK